MKPILEIQNISKKFRIGANQSKYLTLSEKMGSVLKKRNKEETEIWALKDISFDVYPGDTIGIIGKNGAGKSTLLKVLSRITPPTKGKIICRGRIASLLEVGTGFHGELTGRENIYLNGSILGLKKTEINKKFDEIVDFSGVERFLDTQLKHYSSGMQLRLAFAVAAHLEPEILIIDEVLAVGDYEFQSKCVTKMEEVGKQGRTILFVSHNIALVELLCKNCIFLNNGLVISNDKTPNVVQLYLNKSSVFKYSKNYDQVKSGDEIAKLLSIRIIDENIKPKEEIWTTDKIGIEIIYQIFKDDFDTHPYIDFWSEKSEYVFSSISTVEITGKKGIYRTILWIEPELLNNINYYIGIGLHTLNKLGVIYHFYDKESIFIEVKDNFSSIMRKTYKGNYGGLIRPLLKWDKLD